LISDASELAPLYRVMRRAQEELDSLAPEEISAQLITAIATESESARLAGLVERNLRRGFPQTQAEVSGAAKWILIAGTGSSELPAEVVRLTERLGETLAARGLNLVVGGFQGIDNVVGRAFADAVQASGEAVESRFLQILAPGKRPDLGAGRIVHTKNEFVERVKRADAVVLIGGRGGTYGSFEHARRQGKPAYPLPTTGGDARRIFDEFLASQRKGEISARRLALLEVDILDGSGIDVLLRRLMALIEGAHGERAWADALLSLVSNLLPTADLTAYPNLRDYLSELAASAGDLEYESFRPGQKAKPSGALTDERLRQCLPAASIWISFDILRIAKLYDFDKWNKGSVIHVLIPLLFEFCPEEAEWTLAMAARFDPGATATAAELVEAADRLREKYNSVWAERFYRLVLDKANYDQDQASRATARIGLGCIEILRGNLKGAEQMFEQAREMPGGNDPRYLSRLYDGLATVHFMSGEIVRAQTEQEQALKVAGSDSRDRSIALNHLGRIHRTLGDFPAAEKLHQEALDLAAQTGLAEEIVAAIAELGITYRQVDTLQRAEEQQRRALEISEQVRDPGLTAQALNNLAGVLRQRGELTSAEAMNRRALALCEGIGGRQGIAESFAGIGFVFRVRGNLAEAEKNFRLALEINSEMGRRFGVADNSNELGSIHRVRGEVQDAQRMHESALEINRKANRLPNLADTYNSLGLVNRVRGEVPEAISWYQQALTLNEKMGREGGIADSLVNLSSAFRRQGRVKEAEDYCQRALTINERIDRVPAIARTCTNLGQIVYDRKQMETAEEYFRRALALDERVGRVEGIAENQYQLGRIAAERGDTGLARGLMSEALEMYRSGGFRPKVATITRELDRLGSGSSKGSSSEYL
jgi:tetratricopeptide (TPR) repeat protein